MPKRTRAGRFRGDGPPARRERPRPLAVLVLLVAALASMATQPPETQVSIGEQGPPLLLSSEEGAVTARFELESNEVALGAARVAVRLRQDVFWDGLDEDLDGGTRPDEAWDDEAWDDEEGLVVAADVRLGDGPAARVESDGGLCDGPPHECVGTYEVAFRWPRGVEARAARIEWAVTATFEFERERPPEADGAIVFEAPEIGAPVRIAQGTMALNPREPLAVHEVSIRLDGALPDDAALAVEIGAPPRWQAVDVPISVLEPASGDPPRSTGPGRLLPLRPPEECRHGPCTFPVLIAGQLSASGAGQQDVPWGITAPASAPVADVAWEPRPPPAARATADLDSVRLSSARPEAEAIVRLHIPASLLQSVTLPPRGPFIHAYLEVPSEQRQGLPAEIDIRLEILGFLDSEAQWEHPPGASYVVPHSCQKDQACELELEALFRLRHRWPEQPDVRVDLDPVLTVTVAHHPFADQPPEGELVIDVWLSAD